MAVVLDLVKARELGAMLPRAGVMRGEYVTVHNETKPEWVNISFSEDVYRGKQFEVPRAALTTM